MSKTKRQIESPQNWNNNWQKQPFLLLSCNGRLQRYLTCLWSFFLLFSPYSAQALALTGLLMPLTSDLRVSFTATKSTSSGFRSYPPAEPACSRRGRLIPRSDDGFALGYKLLRTVYDDVLKVTHPFSLVAIADSFISFFYFIIL